MDEFLDNAWIWISNGLEAVALVLDALVRPLEALGPAWVILFLAFATIGISRGMKRIFSTKRHEALEKEFRHWQSVREEAMKADDPEKGRALAKNIDQAQLNRAYYDYFFEGFMLHMFTTVLPILLTLAYLSRTYTMERLAHRFGSPWIFSLGSGREAFLNVGTLFWYIICIFLAFAGFAVAGRLLRGRRTD